MSTHTSQLLEMVSYDQAVPGRDDELVIELCDAFLEGLVCKRCLQLRSSIRRFGHVV